MRIVNRKARYNYHILESFEAGIVLSGAEVKSLRLGKADLSNGFARIQSGEVYLVNVYIFPHLGQDATYDTRKTRKLLLHKNQTKALIGKLSSKGKALIPLSIYEKNNMFKVQLALAQTKRKFDKKKVIKEKDEQRDLERELRGLKVLEVD